MHVVVREDTATFILNVEMFHAACIFDGIFAVISDVDGLGGVYCLVVAIYP